MSAHADQTRKQVKLLAYAGLLPFMGLSVLLWLVDPDLHPFVALALAGYGASIVSFLGGIHWGIGFRNASRMHNAPMFNFGWGVVPSLLACIDGVMNVRFHIESYLLGCSSTHEAADGGHHSQVQAHGQPFF